MELDPAFEPPSPLWALLGAGGDALGPLGVDLIAHGPGAVVAGPSRSGRSSALLTAARSLLAAGTPWWWSPRGAARCATWPGSRACSRC
ncbi:hypothetical protein [Thermocatellispora tengchongensis]|uniref:hypothetical protein n=1 Tax=Thermocatellispora tengchongensis TaxID=1073253 RepID=UPI003629B6BC